MIPPLAPSPPVPLEAQSGHGGPSSGPTGHFLPGPIENPAATKPKLIIKYNYYTNWYNLGHLTDVRLVVFGNNGRISSGVSVGPRCPMCTVLGVSYPPALRAGTGLRCW